MRGWGAALGGERHGVRDVEVFARAPPVWAIPPLWVLCERCAVCAGAPLSPLVFRVAWMGAGLCMEARVRLFLYSRVLLA